jgi:hypothetical protein
MNKEDLQDSVKDCWENRYEELKGKIDNALIIRSENGFGYDYIGTEDYRYSIDGEDTEFYPLWMYEKITKALEADGLEVRRWKFLGIKLNYWTVKWGEKK